MRNGITTHAESEMTCLELVQLVTDYLEEKLSSSEHARFNAHLRTCSGCTAYVEQLRTTIQMVGEINEASISPEGKRDLLATFRLWKSGRHGD